MQTKMLRTSVLALQSHYDDLSLSASGMISAVAGNMTLVTTHSASHQTRERRTEDAILDTMLSVSRYDLDLPERSGRPERWPDIPTPARSIILGPAAVGRSIDHLATSELAEIMGADIFWEDVAFWGIYGMSTDDRLDFTMRRREWLSNKRIVHVAIDATVEHKRAILHAYKSQSVDVWRPLRYAWTCAREAHLKASFAERLFVTERGRSILIETGFDLSPGPTIAYGQTTLSSEWCKVR
ncbi:hypothetical protein [Pseudactinotalea sp. HY158]|uniref:hypothetical protein n=1 Tax=Pseudactinotalea sp. HY158 TaxID=2654547 RepID=UPI00129CAE52|nr:hypothetical protein [Pseudactinotalea sp. HY158]QGH68692.1 hypothetical protein GCE65_03650 [Pseudactinotalea sp. HY158]